MRNIKLYPVLRQAALLGAVLAAFSCSNALKEEEAPASANRAPVVKGTVHFRAGLVETKAQFGEKEGDAYPTLWTANDAALKLSLNYGSAQEADITPSANFRSATFSADLDLSDVEAPYTFYAVSPSSAAQALSPSREAWKVTIPCEQTPTAGSVDEAGIILASASIPYDSVSSTEEVDLFFDHLTAYGRLSLGNLDLGEASVKVVELTVTTPFVGDWYWSCGEGHTLLDYGASSTLTLHTTRTSDIWFACAPVSVGEEVLVVRVYTNTGVYEKLTAFPAGARFQAGRTAVFTINMEGADFTADGSPATGSDFERVTDASTLAAGDEVLIVYEGDNVALGAQNGSYRSAVGVSISNYTIANSASATVLTLRQGNSSGTWAFQDGEKYLASVSSGNTITTVNNINANSSWTVSITEGKARITAQAGGSTLLQYNHNFPRFNCYKSTSNMKDVQIYRRKAGGSVSTEDPMLTKTEYGIYLTDSGLEWTLRAGKDQVSRSYTALGVQTYALIGPADIEELEISGYSKDKVKGDNVTVSVSWRKGWENVHSASYAMQLIKEEGPKVWLSDGNGNGCIIKK